MKSNLGLIYKRSTASWICTTVFNDSVSNTEVINDDDRE